MSTKIVKNDKAIAFDLSNDRLAEYFGLDIDTIIGIRDRIMDFVLTPGYHSVTDQMITIDEEYTDFKENIYAKFSYGMIMGQIIAKQFIANAVEGGIQ